LSQADGLEFGTLKDILEKIRAITEIPDVAEETNLTKIQKI